MQEESKRHMAPIPAPGSKGNGKANNGSTFEQKTLSGGVWHTVGTITRAGEGLRIDFTVFKDDYHIFLTRRELSNILKDRFPGDLVSIQETPGEVIISIIGKAFRSRTGRALMIRTPYYSGDMMVPWQAFQNVLAGIAARAPISVLELPMSADNVQQERNVNLSHGLKGCF